MSNCATWLIWISKWILFPGWCTVLHKRSWPGQCCTRWPCLQDTFLGRTSSRPVEPSRLGPSTWVVPSSLGVRCHLQDVGISSCGRVCYLGKHKAFFVRLQFQIPWYGSKMLFNITGMMSAPVFPSFTHLGQVLRVISSTNISLVPVNPPPPPPLWPQKEWFADLLTLGGVTFFASLAMEYSGSASHQNVSQRSGDASTYARKLSRESSSILTFRWRLRKLSLQTSEDS